MRWLGTERILAVILAGSAILAAAGSSGAQTPAPSPALTSNASDSRAAGTRTPTGPTTLFDVPGEYPGRFTVVGGAHGTAAEVFTVTVMVRRPSS